MTERICRKCDRLAEYTHSDRRGDVFKCPNGHRSVYPMHYQE